MKNIYYLLLILMITNCSNTEDANKDDISSIKQSFNTEFFIDNIVGYSTKEGDVKIIISENDLLESFNIYSKKYASGVTATSLKVLEIEKKSYIRYYNTDGSVSTVALVHNNNGINHITPDSENNFIQIGKTVCRTKTCISCCGCIPDGSYCKNCSQDHEDCERTTSG